MELCPVVLLYSLLVTLVKLVDFGLLGVYHQKELNGFLHAEDLVVRKATQDIGLVWLQVSQAAGVSEHEVVDLPLELWGELLHGVVLLSL